MVVAIDIFAGNRHRARLFIFFTKTNTAFLKEIQIIAKIRARLLFSLQIKNLKILQFYAIIFPWKFVL